jgi:Zn-dependent peptidase ImmA (M78 family)
VQAEEAGRAAAGSNDNKPRTRYTMAQEFIHILFKDMGPNSIFKLMSGEDKEDMLSFITAQ